MADTTTTTLALVKPGVNDPAGQDLWGAKINGNMDTIDGALTPATTSQMFAGTDNLHVLTSKRMMDASVPQTLTDAATIAWNGALGFNAEVTLAGNRTLGAMTNPFKGVTYALRIIQDATGSRTLAYNACYDFGGAGTPTLSTTATKDDMLYLYCVDAAAPRFKASFSKGT